ncbi:hypothetical protein BZG02_16330 [Labilibaculum filiforme]|uniref:DUF1697 domain-containing protein n=1 Tax=Labilibaculum filiforme TaxID=1940526 RepID=A0A2N3HT18_9BACT|nr:DUF1697 domain-containing protein [Labilibaculum filiforme]PKQ61200.1 hypothetical protein BZG02_16330 [Labilibaculum filiforme]
MNENTKYISLLRGINVGGKRKILMADLKDMYADLGFTNCKSYIQSGNVIFDYQKCPNHEVALIISQNILKKYGFEVPVIVRTQEEWQQSVQTNPYIGIHENKNLCLTFLNENPKEDLIKTISALNFEPDCFQIIHKDIFIYCSGPYHKTKLSNQFFESKLKVKATSRNWNTVLKLLELSAT